MKQAVSFDGLGWFELGVSECSREKGMPCARPTDYPRWYTWNLAGKASHGIYAYFKHAPTMEAIAASYEGKKVLKRTVVVCLSREYYYSVFLSFPQSPKMCASYLYSLTVYVLDLCVRYTLGSIYLESLNHVIRSISSFTPGRNPIQISMSA